MLLICGIGEDSWGSLGLQGDQTINPKENDSRIFMGRTDAEAEAPILWPSDAKSWLIGKDSDTGKDWRQGEKGMTEDKMVGWHHQLSGHEFEQALRVGEGQGSLACCTPWGHKELTTTEKWTAKYICTSTSISLLFFNILFHYGLSQDIEYSPLCYRVGPCGLSILYIKT